MYRILSCDGGGYRGIYTSRILERLETMTQGFLGRINMFAGTSTGAILACALAKGLNPAEITRLYKEKGGDIFKKPGFWEKVKDLGGVSGATYKNDGLKKALENVFGNMTFGDFGGRGVLVVSFDLDTNDTVNGIRRWKPKIWNSLDPQDVNTKIADVLLMSTAAPTYFPSYKGFVDGGVCQNNPSMCALALGIKFESVLNNIRLLSVGCGLNNSYIAGESNDWGLFQWAKPMPNMMIDGDVDCVDYQVNKVLGAKYLRINAALPMKIDLDDTSKTQELLTAADRVDLSRYGFPFWE